MIALDRVLAIVEKSESSRKTSTGVKADPPAIFFSKTPAVMVNLVGEPIWSPDQGQRPEVRRQHELGFLPARSDQDVSTCGTGVVAQGLDTEEPWSAAGKRPESLAKLPADDNWKDIRRALRGGSVDQSLPHVLVSTGARRADPAPGRAELPAGRQARPISSGSRTRTAITRQLLPCSRPWSRPGPER